MGLLRALFEGHVMVVAPHFDDEVLGCGGVLLKTRSHAQRLSIVHLAGCPTRSKEFEPVARGLDVSFHACLEFEDGYLAAAQEPMVKSMLRLVQELRPDVVLVPHAHDNHPDHEAAHVACIDAIDKASFWKPEGRGVVHKPAHVLEYEVWFPMKEVSVAVDVTDVFAQKKELLRAYASQTSGFPYFDYLDCLNGWRSMLFKKSGRAEAFRLRCL